MDVRSKYLDTRAKLFELAGVEPESRFVETDGPVQKVHYLHIGSGDPLVIVHGGLGHASEWINVLKPLAEKFTLYVPDRPGHGLTDPIDYTGIDYPKSAADFMRSFLDAVGLDKASFLGNSMGGYFSIQFAFEYPERVVKLLMIGAPAGMNYWIPPPLRLMGIPVLNRLLMKTLARPSVSAVKMIHKAILAYDVDNIPDAHFEHTYYGQLLPGAAVAHRTLLESVITLKGWRKGLYIGDQLHRLRVPVGFIWGDKDAFESPETGKEKAKAIENHVFEVVEQAGHCPWFDRPERCAELILEMGGK